MKQADSILRILVLSMLILFAGCVSPSTASNDFRAASENKLSAGDNQNKLINGNAARTVAAESLFVILSSVSIRAGKLELENEFWGHEEVAEEAKLYPDDKIEIDIMNCAGYLASATTNYRTEGGMRKAELIEGTVAKDALEKVKKCRAGKDIYGDKVFGIAPRSLSRKNIEIGKVDIKKLYDSLIKDTAEMKKIEKSKENAIPQFKGKKGKLVLGEDGWTDLNGDGQIDLIEFNDESCAENDTCTWIFRLINGKWKAIDYVAPL